MNSITALTTKFSRAALVESNRRPIYRSLIALLHALEHKYRQRLALEDTPPNPRRATQYKTRYWAAINQAGVNCAKAGVDLRYITLFDTELSAMTTQELAQEKSVDEAFRVFEGTFKEDLDSWFPKGQEQS